MVQLWTKTVVLAPLWTICRASYVHRTNGSRPLVRGDHEDGETSRAVTPTTRIYLDTTMLLLDMPVYSPVFV